MLLHILTLVIAQPVSYTYALKFWEQASEDDYLDGTLRKISVIYTHGHREPVDGYPTDPHIDSPIWTFGPGQLTKIGRLQGFHFGENLRSRYRYLLPLSNAFKSVRAFSSRSSRAMMTSSVVLAGLLPPKDEEVWSKHLAWHPTVVYHSEILGVNLQCPRLDRLKKLENHTLKPVSLYYFASLHSGKSLKTPMDMLSLCTHLAIQYQAGLDIPEWAQKQLAQMKLAAAKAFQYNKQILRLEVGRLLNEVTQYNVSKKNSRVNLYCTHSSTVGNVLAAFKFNLTEPPNFLSALIVEFRELKNEMHIQLWYRVGPYDDLTRLTIPDCDVRCPLPKVRDLVAPMIPKDWAAECDFQDSLSIITHISYSISFVIVLILAFFVNKYSSKITDVFYSVWDTWKLPKGLWPEFKAKCSS